MLCPYCQTPVHEVFFGDNIKRWRCMGCQRILSELEYEIREEELVRKWYKRKGIYAGKNRSNTNTGNS